MKEIADILQVVLVTYNRARALDHMLVRIFADASPIRNCSITVLDNCSTDGTRAMLDGYAARHPNLSVVTHRRNIGGNANIVRAFEMAEKEYHWVLCDDDDIDWSRWAPVGEALASDAYDLIYTVVSLSRQTATPDFGNLAFLAAFLPGCIYRSSHVTSDVLQNMYAMIPTWYPQCVLSLHVLCNLKGRVFRPAENVVLRQMPSEDGSREMTTEENDRSLVRGMSETLLHPDLKRMFWHIGFVRVAQIVTDPALREEVIARTRFDESWEADFRTYCECVLEYNDTYRGGSAKNIFDFMLNLPPRLRATFVWTWLKPKLPVFLNVSRREIELVVFWKIKLRLWDPRWFAWLRFGRRKENGGGHGA